MELYRILFSQVKDPQPCIEFEHLKLLSDKLILESTFQHLQMREGTKIVLKLTTGNIDYELNAFIFGCEIKPNELCIYFRNAQQNFMVSKITPFNSLDLIKTLDQTQYVYCGKRFSTEKLLPSCLNMIKDFQKKYNLSIGYRKGLKLSHTFVFNKSDYYEAVREMSHDSVTGLEYIDLTFENSVPEFDNVVLLYHPELKKKETRCDIEDMIDFIYQHLKTNGHLIVDSDQIELLPDLNDILSLGFNIVYELNCEFQENWPTSCLILQKTS
jgi:hypothetical protein